MTTIQSLIAANRIVIVSGEGERGHIEAYQGARTMRAIKARLTRERCGGDRWARAEVYSHESAAGPVGVDVMSGEQRHWHEAS